MRAAYEEVEVIHGIDATFEEGVVTAVLGANGAGKSTLLALAAGIMGPSEGEVRFAGEKVRAGSTSSLGPPGALPDSRGSRRVPESDRAGEPVGHDAQRFRATSRRALRVRTVSAPGGSSRPAGRHAVGRRAADAGARPRRGNEPAIAHARRALDGACAHRRRRALQPCRPAGGGGHHRRGGGAIRTHRAVGRHLGHGHGERTDRPDRGGTATWSRCSILPTWGPFNLRRRVHPAHNGTSDHSDTGGEDP